MCRFSVLCELFNARFLEQNFIYTSEIIIYKDSRAVCILKFSYIATVPDAALINGGFVLDVRDRGTSERREPRLGIDL